MDYKIKITTALLIAYALFVLYIVVKRFWFWWTEVRGYKYYLVSKTFINSVDGRNDVMPWVTKIKAKTKSEAIELFTEATKDIIYTDEGKIACRNWDELEYYSSKK